MATPTETLVQSAKEIVSYPMLTREVGSDGMGSGSGRNGSTPSLSATAQEAIRAVLGWRFRADDASGFRAALLATAEPRQVDGHREWNWRSPTYMVQADLGEITGAQASLLEQAKATIDRAKPLLLSRLKPIRNEPDSDDIAAVTSLISNQLDALIEEYGRIGGPRVPRVDGTFLLLLGGHTEWSDVNIADAQLALLARRLGVGGADAGRRVNTLDEERIYTDFLILEDLVTGLRDGWKRHRARFLGATAEGFLGSVLVRLSRYLDVIVESVHETCAAMDSVFFGPAERETYILPFDDETLPGSDTKGAITVADLLGWVESFAAGEARRMVQDAGKDGVLSVAYTLERQQILVGAARTHAERDAQDCRGIRSERVRRALCELEHQLAGAVDGLANVGRVELIPLSRPNAIAYPVYERAARAALYLKHGEFDAMAGALRSIVDRLDGATATLPLGHPASADLLVKSDRLAVALQSATALIGGGQALDAAQTAALRSNAIEAERLAERILTSKRAS